MSIFVLIYLTIGLLLTVSSHFTFPEEVNLKLIVAGIMTTIGWLPILVIGSIATLIIKIKGEG